MTVLIESEKCNTDRFACLTNTSKSSYSDRNEVMSNMAKVSAFK